MVRPKWPASTSWMVPPRIASPGGEGVIKVRGDISDLNYNTNQDKTRERWKPAQPCGETSLISKSIASQETQEGLSLRLKYHVPSCY